VRGQLATWCNADTDPFGGKRWGFRHGIRIRPSDLDNWDAYLKRVQAHTQPPVTPDIDLRWVVECVPDPLNPNNRSLHLALENWTAEPSMAFVREVEPSFFRVQVSLELPATAHRGLLLERVKPSYRYNEYLRYPAIGFNGGVVRTDAGANIRLDTTWTPRYVLPRVEATDHGVNRVIADLAKPHTLASLDPLITAYEDWLTNVRSHPIGAGIQGPDAAEQLAREQTRFQTDLAAWSAELEAIRCGLAILKESAAHWSGSGPQADPLGIPYEAWLSMNAAMATVAERKGYTTWRLFQLAFILASIPTFATRIATFRKYYTPAVREHANAVTLLYFATGGGKSEAFLGLLLFVLFLDRLRGKERGISALMRYPLRLLTLQQSRRTFAVMGAGEAVRYARSHPGEPFSLGFWVGGTNTPNWHADEDYTLIPTVEKTPPADESKLKGDTGYQSAHERWLKLTNCPFCNERSLVLRRAVPKEDDTLGHYCTSDARKCSWNARFSAPTALPFYIVDEDIYCRAPSVLLGTVDKLSALGQSQGTIRKFFGMFGFAPVIEVATERLRVPKDAKAWDGLAAGELRGLFPTFASGERRFFDPFPALLIQDEAHLLDESLGTFAGLFESALEAGFDELAKLLPASLLSTEPGATSRRRVKVIAASATVSEPARQMRNLYQRSSTLQFPHPGPTLYSSFYAEPKGPDNGPEDAERRALPQGDVELCSHWARVYAGVLTNGHRHTVAMAGLLGQYHLIITSLYERLRSADAGQTDSARQELVRWLSAGPHRPQFERLLRAAHPDELLTLVDLHRIALTYVTNKKGGDQVIDTEAVQFDKLHTAHGLTGQSLNSELLSGAISAAEIQDIVRRAETRVKPGDPFPNLNETLRSIVATSAISHGVDVEEFNAMFFAGMPSDIAEYIQASSRVGRTHVGFSLLVPIPQRRRDRFITEIHDIFHRFLERMILPAAVDRWAEKALVRVMPSFFQEYLCGVHAIEGLCAAADNAKAGAVTYREALHARNAMDNSTERAAAERFMGAALGLNVRPAPEGLAYYWALLQQELAAYATDLQQPMYTAGTQLGKFFETRNRRLRPMTSLRDVDEPGQIVESGIDAHFHKVPDEATISVMRFIRGGSGADSDDTPREVEGASGEARRPATDGLAEPRRAARTTPRRPTGGR
jgi:Helicase conserved C-terminal domain